MSRLDIEFTRPQSIAYSKVKPRSFGTLAWSRGNGKSWFLRTMMWMLEARYKTVARDALGKSIRGCRTVWLMPTLKQFKDIHGALVADEVQNTWGFLGGKLDRTTYRIDFPSGGWVQPFPAELHSSKTARGLRADAILCDEADDIPIGVYQSVARPWFTEPWSLKIGLNGGTPRRGKRGLLYHGYKLGGDELHPRYWSTHATYRDAPEIVDPDEVEDARRTFPPAVFAREFECDFNSAEGLVYPGFDERFHVQPNTGHEVWTDVLIGGDFGYEDPGVLLLIGVQGHGRDATGWVIDEIYEQHQTEEWWLDKMRTWMRWFPAAKLYHDPSAKARVEAYRKSAGARPQQVDNSIKDGIDAVSAMLHISGIGDKRKSRLLIHPKCTGLIYELGAYKRKADQLNPDSYLETPVDRDNHACDSLRYAILNYFGPVVTTSKLRFGSHDVRD